jgi:hypothetical protein
MPSGFRQAPPLALIRGRPGLFLGPSVYCDDLKSADSPLNGSRKASLQRGRDVARNRRAIEGSGRAMLSTCKEVRGQEHG